MPARLVMTALRQFSAGIGAGDVGIEMGGVVGEQASTHHLLFFPQAQQAELGLVPRIFGRGKRVQALGENLLQSIPKVLRAETFGRESPRRFQNGAAIPVGHFGLGAGLTDPMDRRQQYLVSRRGARAGRRAARSRARPPRRGPRWYGL